MSDQHLVVEDRTRAILAYLETLKQVALLVQEPVDVPFFDDLPRFAVWVHQMADVAHANTRAVWNALPPSVANLPTVIDAGRR